MKYEKEIRAIIAKHLKDFDTAEITDADLNLQSIGLNSIAFVKIVVEIESEFAIEFPDDMLALPKANTVRLLCEITEGAAASV